MSGTQECPGWGVCVRETGRQREAEVERGKLTEMKTQTHVFPPGFLPQPPFWIPPTPAPQGKVFRCLFPSSSSPGSCFRR